MRNPQDVARRPGRLQAFRAGIHERLKDLQDTRISFPEGYAEEIEERLRIHRRQDRAFWTALALALAGILGAALHVWWSG